MASTAIWPRPGASQSGLTQGYANGDGVKLHFVRAGEGELMLFLHGAPDSGALYMSQLTEFSRDHMVVAPDLRGFPPSDHPKEVDAYVMPRLLGDVHALLRHFGREKCILVGNDLGGYIAWVFASAYPGRVERLIILNAPHPAIYLREVRNSAAQIQASQYEREYHKAVAPYPALYNYYRADPIKVPSSIADAANMETPDLAARFFADGAEPPATRSLRVDVPTLVLWGMQDPVCLPGQLDNLHDHAPKATVVRIEDAGHRPMQSHPVLVNRAIRDFLRRA
ncbi:MAG: alpha/beta hydrolase [Bradyrhizobium sp.]|nr:alpha/beta hydrolase [Bradyrhizobium sp.]